MEKLTITIQTTPADLRNWASMLESADTKTVTIHWYQTHIVLEKPYWECTRCHAKNWDLNANECINCYIPVLGDGV